MKKASQIQMLVIKSEGEIVMTIAQTSAAARRKKVANGKRNKEKLRQAACDKEATDIIHHLIACFLYQSGLSFSLIKLRRYSCRYWFLWSKSADS